MSDIGDVGDASRSTVWGVDSLVLLDVARAEFQRRVPVDRAPLGSATPCEQWNVGELLQHVIVGNYMAVMMLGGRRRDEVDAARTALMATDLEDAPSIAFARSAEEQSAAFAASGALERLCHNPVGDIPGTQLLAFRICDLALHAWDLSRATGANEPLNDELVAWVLRAMSTQSSTLASTGQFGDGPSGTLTPSASPLDRLLDLSGRRP